MKKGLIAGVLLVLLVVAPVVAAVAYSATITVTEELGAAHSRLPVSATVNNAYLAEHGFITPSGLDTRVMHVGTELPHMLADDRTLFVTDIEANSQRILDYTTGNAALSSFSIITGHGGYLVVPDGGNIELGDNFELELKGYVDTTNVGLDLAVKPGAFRKYVSADGVITFAILQAGAAGQTAVLRVDGNSRPLESSRRGAPTHWEAVRYHDADESYIQEWADSWRLNMFNLEMPWDVWSVDSVRVFFTGRATLVGSTLHVHFQPVLRLGGQEVVGTNQFTTATSYHTWSEVLARPGGGDWTVGDVDNLEVGMKLLGGWCATRDDWNHARLTELYVEITYTKAVSWVEVSATGIASEERTIKTTADGTNLRLFVDGIEKASTALGGATTTNNSSWTRLYQPYLNHATLSVAGTRTLWYQPNTIITHRPLFRGIADSGTTRSIVDSALTQERQYWRGVTVVILETTDGALPQGEVAAVTGFSDTADELSFSPALTAPVEAGDVYELRGPDGALPDRTPNSFTADFGTTTTLSDDALNQVDDYWNNVTLRITATLDGLAPQGEEQVVTNFVQGVTGTADSGTTTTLVDNALTQADGHWNNLRLRIVTTTDGLAPQGETAVITNFTAIDDTLHFPALTAPVDAGDTYKIYSQLEFNRYGFSAAVEAGDTYELRNDGRLVWGTAPVSVSMGALLPETLAVAGIPAVTEDPTFVPPAGVEFATVGVEGEGFLFYGLFKDLLSDWHTLGGPNISMPYFWRVVAVVITWIFGTAVMLATRNLLFGLLAYFVGFAVAAGTMDILGMWVPIVYAIGAICTSLLVVKWGASSL